jgi:hypothetical protein
MEEAAVVEVFSVIAEKLFGEDAFRAPDVARPIVRDELYRFISAIVAHVWNKMRKTVVGQYDRLQAGKALARDGFDSKQSHLMLRGHDYYTKRISHLRIEQYRRGGKGGHVRY